MIATTGAEFILGLLPAEAASITFCFSGPDRTKVIRSGDKFDELGANLAIS